MESKNLGCFSITAKGASRYIGTISNSKTGPVASEGTVWSKFKIFDIAANMTDETFRGIYRGKQKHPDDYESVIARARSYGV